MNRSARLTGRMPENILDDIARPFAGDLLERTRLSDRLTTYIDRLREGAVIAIDASWGEGKTWFARHWAASLQRTGHPVAYLDAFCQNDELDPFFILAAELAPVFESIRNPVMKDLTLTFDAKSGGEIHPRALTHLYADRPLVVYGRVPKSTNGVTCQLTGRSAEAPYDAVFAFDFAEATHTARDLRRAWAARAMFDLLAEYAENPSAALLRRIEAFSRAYGVPNPYRRGK